MLVWSTPASNYFDPDYCNNTEHGCDIEMGKQEAIWVNAFSFLGCIFGVPFAGWLAVAGLAQYLRSYYFKASQWGR